MAGANNRALAKAGMSRSQIETFRAQPIAPRDRKVSAGALAMRLSPEVQAKAAGFRAGAAAFMKARAAQEAGKARRGDMTRRGLRDATARMLASRKAAAKPVTREPSARMLARRDLRNALESAARDRAARSSDEMQRVLDAGTKVYVKGKPTMQPFSETGRKMRLGTLREQFGHSTTTESAIDSVLRPHYGRLGIKNDRQADRLYRAALSVYQKAGVAEVNRRFQK